MDKIFKFGKIEKKDTMIVVSKMMSSKLKEISPIAIEYLNYLSKTYGFCGEIMVTAFANYCQATLGLPCEDENYRITDENTKWFKDNGYNFYQETDMYKPYPDWEWNNLK